MAVIKDKNELDWKNIGFTYHQTDYRYVADFKDGRWEKGALTGDADVTLNECAGILQYCQQCFEGLKAYSTEDGHIAAFRPDQNAERMIRSASGLEMPPFPKDQFLEAVDEVVRANRSWVPPFGTGATLYIRPYLFAKSPVIGIKPAEEYQFRILCTPVGPYFKGGIKPMRICVSDTDRAASRGTGAIKAGINYAMSLRANVKAHRSGFDENMFLDPATHTFVEETGGANFLFVTREKEIVIPKSGSILPSITRKSLIEVARNYLHLKVSERPVWYDELGNFDEAGVCGTAAVVTPVGEVVGPTEKTVFPGSSKCMGPVLKQLYDTLTGIQMGTIEAPEGWIRTII